MPIGTYAEPRKSPQVSFFTPVYCLEAGSLTEHKGLCFEQTFCPVSSPICLSFPPVLELQTSAAMSSFFHGCWRRSSDLQAFKASTYTRWAIFSKTILQIPSVFLNTCKFTKVFRRKFQTREIKKVVAPNLQELEEAWSQHELSNKDKKTMETARNGVVFTHALSVYYKSTMKRHRFRRPTLFKGCRNETRHLNNQSITGFETLLNLV